MYRIFLNHFIYRSTLPESWAANSFKKLHESLGNDVILTTESIHENEMTGIKTINASNESICNSNISQGLQQDVQSGKCNDDKVTVNTVELQADSKPTGNGNAFMQLTYSQKDICVGNFWEVFCQEAKNQGTSSASFATFLGARAAIPGPSAPQGAWGQFSPGNRSVLDTFRRLRYGKIQYISKNSY